MLWNMVIDSLIRKLNAAGFNTEGFADDIVTLLIGKFEQPLSSLTNTASSIVDKCCTENGLSANPHKTKLVLFTNKGKQNKMNGPKIGGTQ